MLVVLFTVNVYIFVFMTFSKSYCLYDTIMDPVESMRVFAYVRTYVCMYMYVRMYVCVCIYARIYIYMYEYECMYVCMHKKSMLN
jgi:nuclear pore complex protein Nup62